MPPRLEVERLWVGMDEIQKWILSLTATGPICAAGQGGPRSFGRQRAGRLVPHGPHISRILSKLACPFLPPRFERRRRSRPQGPCRLPGTSTRNR